MTKTTKSQRSKMFFAFLKVYKTSTEISCWYHEPLQSYYDRCVWFSVFFSYIFN